MRWLSLLRKDSSPSQVQMLQKVERHRKTNQEPYIDQKKRACMGIRHLGALAGGEACAYA